MFAWSGVEYFVRSGKEDDPPWFGCLEKMKKVSFMEPPHEVMMDLDEAQFFLVVAIEKEERRMIVK